MRPIRTAMVLAAGEGRRLRPLTDVVPKPLVPVGGEPLLRRTLRWLAAQGFERIVVNLFQHAQVARDALTAWDIDADLRISQEPVLLGTGGGIHHALPHWLGDAAWIVNGDVVCDADLRALEATLPPNAGAAMLLRADTAAARLGPVYLRDGRVVGLLNHGETSGEPVMFTGIHLLTRRLAAQLPEPGCVVRDGYIHWLASGDVYAMLHHGYWNEIGTPARLAAVEADWAAGRLGWL